MFLLLLGLVLFLGVHSSRIVAEEHRQRFIAARGEGTWKLVYSAASLIGLVLISIGYGQSRLTPVVVWNPPAGMAHLATLLMLLAFILVAAAYVPGNRLKARFGHPMALGIKLWAFAHLLANGRLSDMLLFGAFFAWAVAAFIAGRRRDRRAADNGVAGNGVSGNASGGNIGITAPAMLSRDIAAVAAGTVAWLVFSLWLHRVLIGVSPFG